jgi:hypothetical protein
MVDLSKVNPKIKICRNSLRNERWMDYYCSYDYDSWKPPESRVSWIMAQIKNHENASILDVGCGAFPVTMNLRAKEKVGMDISLKAAEGVLPYFDEVYIMDLLNMDQSEMVALKERFDYIIVAETLEHFADPYTIIKNFGKYVRYKDFMGGHFTFFSLKQLEFIFHSSSFDIRSFDFRPCDIVTERFPKEKNKLWKMIASLNPHYFGHQFFFNLKRVDEQVCFPNRFRVVIRNGVRVIVEDQPVIEAEKVVPRVASV